MLNLMSQTLVDVDLKELDRTIAALAPEKRGRGLVRLALVGAFVDLTGGP